MYLKEIKIYGFKSFADKIKLEFCPNINGIVGPNGSGKSNVVDAVRFVLGEQSIKSLRGYGNMSDIIFSGSKSRKPLGSASVTLVFDNSDKHLPIDFAEVAIKRVIYRNGETEYSINGSKCRLKDILDLLTDSGTSRESFSIISQGKISEILSTKPEERRIIFEEAAGVLKYKKRKEEAIRKLDRTHNNLNRVNDITSELDSQIEPLKEQSEKAKIYLDNKKRLDDIEISLIAYDLEQMNFDYNKHKARIDEINNELVNSSVNISSKDAKVIETKNKLTKLEEDINAIQNKILEYTKKEEQLRGELELSRERGKNNKKDNSLNDKILELEETSYKIDNELNKLNNTLELTNKELLKIDNLLSEKSKIYQTKKDEKNILNNKLIANTRNITDLKYKISYLENNIENNSSLPSAVKSILNNPKLSGIHDTLGSLIKIKEGFIDAINIALLGSVNNIITTTSEDAKESVNYLKKNNLGRATFFPINVIKKRFIDDETITLIEKEKGFIDIASNLVEYDKTYENIILNQLGNIIVTKSLDDANRISKIIGNKYKIVTIDGNVVNIGGSITGGSISKITNIFTLKKELETNKKELNLIIKNMSEQENVLQKYDEELNLLEKTIYDIRLEKQTKEESLNTIKLKEQEILEVKNKIKLELSDLKNIQDEKVDSEESKKLEEYYKVSSEKENYLKKHEELKLEKKYVSDKILELEEETKEENTYINKLQKEQHDLEIKVNRLDVKMDTLLNTLNQEYSMTFENALKNSSLDMEIDEARNELKKLKEIITNIGTVNLGSIESYETISKRYEFLTSQKEDLINAENTLLEIIKEMDEIMKERFLNTFELIRVEFKKVFRELFKGGNAELKLIDKDNLLETGIDIIAEPPGKKLSHISLLSGGEKTFTAIALLFSILNIRPIPFCLLDEVEAALDEVNVDSFGTYLEKYRDKTQFILITHKKKTMEYADILYGITMQESGVSKIVSVKLEDVK